MLVETDKGREEQRRSPWLRAWRKPEARGREEWVERLELVRDERRLLTNAALFRGKNNSRNARSLREFGGMSGIARLRSETQGSWKAVSTPYWPRYTRKGSDISRGWRGYLPSGAFE